MAFPVGIGTGKLSDNISAPEPKNNWRLTGYRHSPDQLQTSPTPPLPRTNAQHACYTLRRVTLYSMPSLNAVWCSNQLCDPTPLILHNANARLVPTVQECQCGCDLWVVGKRCQTSYTTTLYSHVALCTLHFACVRCMDFQTLYDQPFQSQRWARFNSTCLWMCLEEKMLHTWKSRRTLISSVLLRILGTGNLCLPFQ